MALRGKKRMIPTKEEEKEKKKDKEMVVHPAKEEEKKKKYYLLSTNEKLFGAYKRVDSMSIWKPPRSSHNLIQEEHSFDPWRVLVICILLNLTTGKRVRDVLPGLFNLCPDAQTTANKPLNDIQATIKTLGFQRRRAKILQRFSKEYLSAKWTHVTQLYGVGKYAADAYAIFCAGKPDSVIPKDHMLVHYWKFLCSQDLGE